MHASLFRTKRKFGALAISAALLIGTIPAAGAQAQSAPAPTTLIVSDVPPVDVYDTYQVTATLTDTATGAPIAGATLRFNVCSGDFTTDTNGSATCTWLNLRTPLTGGSGDNIPVLAFYDGDAQHAPIFGGHVTRPVPEETALTYTGDRRISNGTPAHFSALVQDDSRQFPASSTCPSCPGLVTFALGSGASLQSCSANTDASGSAGCSIVPVDQPLPTVPLMISFHTDTHIGTFAWRESSLVTTLLNQLVVCTTTLSGAQGTLVIQPNGTTCLQHATVSGSVQVLPGARLFVEHSSTTGPIVADMPAFFGVCDSSVGGAVLVADASGSVLVGDPTDDACGGNTISAGVVLQNNHSGVEVAANHIGGSLVCSGNNPAPKNDGQPNTVTGARSGQCAGL
jgi:hypothetical protein